MISRSPNLPRSALVAMSIVGSLLLMVAAGVWLSDGFRTDILGLRIRATDPMRPFWIGTGVLAGRWLLRRKAGFDGERQVLRIVSHAPVVAGGLAVLLTCAAFTTNYGVGGGADSYGYVSQADLWLAGDLTVEQEWLRDAPWPHAIQTATPLGYRPAPSGLAIVPVYAPGLPLLFAGAKMLFGQCGIVAVIALMAGLLAAVTYGIGHRVASAQVGAAAAWLTATSPVILFMVASPMSDVPAAALSAMALLSCLRRSRIAAFLGGLAMAAVILIRPNLAPLVAPIGLWLLAFDRQTTTWPARCARGVLFGLGAAPGVIGIALVNASLYGSATASGYGNIDGFFSASHILPNLRNYALWLCESHTPLLLIGVVALILPSRWVAKAHRVGDASLLVLMTAGVTALYLPYQVFDQWWYLRFFLPAWPALAVGTAWIFTNNSGRTYGRTGLAVVLFVGAWGLGFGLRHSAFQVGWGDLRYVSAAHVVREITSPASVILSMQHSGSVRYYGGRRSLRYDWLEPRRFDEAIRWLRSRGHDVYILLEDWEIEGFRRRVTGTEFGGLGEQTVLFRQDVGTRVQLYDTRAHSGERPQTITDFVPSARRCCEPTPGGR
ncbi:MAG: hypothetical protein ABIP90_10120 [Vicinamibacterales bacterium]